MSSIINSMAEACPRCGGQAVGRQDFHSGIYPREGGLVRLHAPRYTLRCLNARCGHAEVVTERSAPDDRWLAAYQPDRPLTGIGPAAALG